MGDRFVGSVVEHQLTMLRGYLRHVGHARLAYFLDPKLDPEANLLCKSAFILIPHFHPGFDARGSQTVVQRRLYLLTYALTWIYLDTAINVVSYSSIDSQDRQKLCEHIMKLADARLMDVGFWSIFEDNKAEMCQTWRLLRLNDSRKRKQVNPPLKAGSYKSNQRHTNHIKLLPSFGKKSTNHKLVHGFLTELLVPDTVVENGIIDLIPESPIEFDFVNYFADDFHGGRLIEDERSLKTNIISSRGDVKDDKSIGILQEESINSLAKSGETAKPALNLVVSELMDEKLAEKP